MPNDPTQAREPETPHMSANTETGFDETGFDSGYNKGYADGLDDSAGDPRVEQLDAGFTRYPRP